MQANQNIPEETLRILLVSDIHLAYENVDKLIQWLNLHSKDVKYDFVLGSGDFGNINHTVLPEDNQAETATVIIKRGLENPE